jgi:hypothetical protein
MKKDELIDLYLLARMMHSQAAFYRRESIRLENFELAMMYEFEMHFWQDSLNAARHLLVKKDWVWDALDNGWVS